jgi:hypothetical protein
MLQVQKDYKPLMWGIQKDMIIRTIGPFLKKMMIEENVILNIQDTIPMNKDKMMNGRAIQGRARQGLVILPERGVDQPEWLQPLEHEIRRFPKGEHDDQVDNLSIVGKMMEDMAGTDKKEKKYKTEAERHIDMILRRPDPEPTASMKDMMRFMPKEKETLYHDVD